MECVSQVANSSSESAPRRAINHPLGDAKFSRRYLSADASKHELNVGVLGQISGQHCLNFRRTHFVLSLDALPALVASLCAINGIRVTLAPSPDFTEHVDGAPRDHLLHIRPLRRAEFFKESNHRITVPTGSRDDFERSVRREFVGLNGGKSAPTAFAVREETYFAMEILWVHRALYARSVSRVAGGPADPSREPPTTGSATYRWLR